MERNSGKIVIVNNEEQNKFKIITEKQLIERAKKSTEDYLAGRIILQEDLEVQSENW